MRPEIQVLQACELPSPISGLFWPFTDGADHAVGSHTMSFSVMQSDQFLLTQEFLAMMLGVQRTGVTAAAGALQRAGLIRYTRGDVTIIDRRGLIRRSCECYGVSNEEFDRLLQGRATRSVFGEKTGLTVVPRKRASAVCNAVSSSGFSGTYDCEPSSSFPCARKCLGRAASLISSWVACNPFGTTWPTSISGLIPSA